MSTTRVSPDGTFIMSFETFRGLEWCSVCDHLGIRPSKPWHNAAGKYVGPKRKRKRKGKANKTAE